ncbi:hypothetical protein BMW23_0836 [Bodo saltans virus]|uniref:Ankyrin repeat protein n=1 Tax=Bodo saltans virus TaxID=2024608 RepID=A0A2H4UVD5_9VIRU|nr:hypothetical protein QJ851_gp0819 [Bodo saltans virus]ATZ80882.1 hypothetical protein BMW23_0836 [Bodo saltans virus]
MAKSYADIVKLQLNKEIQTQIVTFPIENGSALTECCYDHKDAIKQSHIKCLQKMILKYGTVFKSKRTNGWGDDCIVYDDICTYAIEKGNYKMCKWLLDNNYFQKSIPDNELRLKYNNRHIPYYLYSKNSVLEKYATSQIFELLKHLYDKTTLNLDYVKNNIDSDIFWYVRLELVKHAYEKYNNKISIYDAIAQGRIDLIKFCIDNNFEYDIELCLEYSYKYLKELKNQVNVDDIWKCIGLEFSKYQYVIIDMLEKTIIPFFLQKKIE